MARILPSGRIFSEVPELPIVTPAVTRTGMDRFGDVLSMADRVVQSPAVNLAVGALGNIGGPDTFDVGGGAPDSRIQVTPRAQAAQALLAQQQAAQAPAQPRPELPAQAQRALGLIRGASDAIVQPLNMPPLDVVEPRVVSAAEARAMATGPNAQQFIDDVNAGLVVIGEAPQPTTTSPSAGAGQRQLPGQGPTNPSAAGRYAATAEQMRRLAADPRLTEQEFQQLVDMVDQVAPVGYRGGNALEDMATGAHKARLMDDLMRARAGRRIEDPNADLERELLQARIDKMREPPKVDPNADVKRRKLEAEAARIEAEVARLNRRAKGGGSGIRKEERAELARAGQALAQQAESDMNRAQDGMTRASAEMESLQAKVDAAKRLVEEAAGAVFDEDKPPPAEGAGLTQKEKDQRRKALDEWRKRKAKFDERKAKAIEQAKAAEANADAALKEAEKKYSAFKVDFDDASELRTRGQTAAQNAWAVPSRDELNRLKSIVGAAVPAGGGRSISDGVVEPAPRQPPAAASRPVRREVSRPGMTKPVQPSDGRETAPSKTGTTEPAPRPGSAAPSASSEPKVRRTLADL